MKDQGAGVKVILAAISVPLLLLNAFSGIVGGIWLLVEGEWLLVVISLLISVVTAQAFLIVGGIPLAVLSISAAAMLDKSKINLAILLMSLSALWTATTVTISVIFVVQFIATRIDGPALPYALLAFASAAGPWKWLASKEAEGGNDNSALGTLFIIGGCLAVGIAILIDPTDSSHSRFFVIFVPFMIVLVVVQTVVGVITARGILNQSRGYHS